MSGKDEEHPKGWYEPLAEGLWRVEEMFGVPRMWCTFHLAFWPLALLHSMKWVLAETATHILLAWLTHKDPEWPAVLGDWLREPGEIEP